MSDNLDKKIQKLLTKSLFLSGDKKNEINKKLLISTDKEKKALLDILKDEEKAVHSMLEDYIKTNGVDKLDTYLKNTSKNITKNKYKPGKTGDFQ